MQKIFYACTRPLLLDAKKGRRFIKSVSPAYRKGMCRLAICTKGVRLWGTPGEGSPPKNSPLDCFSPLLRSLWAKISQPAGCDGGAAPQPRRLLKKAAENFWAFCYRKTVYQQIGETLHKKRLPWFVENDRLCYRLSETGVYAIGGVPAPPEPARACANMPGFFSFFGL